MAETRALLFDFGGTLDADGVPWETRAFAAYRRAGGTSDEARFSKAFRASDRELETTGAVRGLGVGAMAQHQLELMNRIDPTLAIEAKTAASTFAGEARAIARRNVPVLDRLRRRFALGIVSNFTGNLRECLLELELAGLFTVALDSFVVGIQKPEAGIFTKALEAVSAKPEEAFMIGDNPWRDVEAAAKLGMKTCWLAPAARPLPDRLAPTIRVASLLELEGALASCAA